MWLAKAHAVLVPLRSQTGAGGDSVGTQAGCVLGPPSWHHKDRLARTTCDHCKEFSDLLAARSFGRMQAKKRLLPDAGMNQKT